MLDQDQNVAAACVPLQAWLTVAITAYVILGVRPEKTPVVFDASNVVPLYKLYVITEPPGGAGVMVAVALAVKQLGTAVKV